MKKIPLALATLGVMSGVCSSDAAARSMVTESGATTRVILGGNEDGTITANYEDTRFQIVEVRPEEGTIKLRLETEEVELLPGIWFFGTYDYEKITEAEADAAWVAMTAASAAKPEWTDIYQSIYTMPGLRREPGVYENLFFVSSGEKVDAGLTLSVTDVAYYRVHLGEHDSSDQNAGMWLVGKIDYRNCIHDAGYTGVCTAVRDGETGKVVFSADGSGEVRDVMSWPEEWGELTRKRYEELEGKVKGWLEKGELTEEEASEFQKEIEAIKRALKGSTGVDEVATGVARLEKWVANGRVDEEEGNEAPRPSTQRPVIGGQGSQGSVTDEELNEGSDDNVSVEGSSASEAGVEQGSLGGGAEADQGLPESETGVDQGWTMTAVGGEMVSEEVTEEADSLAEAARGDGATGIQEEPEVPQLGGEKQGWKGWPWLIIILSVTGVASWWLWRAFGRRTRR